jgi:CheY-like chemotaxis protein
MPDEDGYSFVRRLRDREHHQQLSRLPAIAVTAYGAASDREQAFRAGFDVHLPKPVDPDVLVRAVSRFAPAAGA